MKHMFIVSEPETGLLSDIQATCHLVLPHLYFDHKGYVDFYRNLSRKGHFIMQDNSLFELKETVGGDLIEFAKEIEAREVVVPEVLRDYKGCIEKTEEFLDRAPKIGRFHYAAVIQANNYSDLVKHYKWLSKNSDIKTVCIPFNFEFDAYGNYSEEAQQLGWNRFSIIYRMVVDRVWNPLNFHHLLGLFNPVELAMYRMLPGSVRDSIRSNDSSSCFWHALYNTRFSFDRGLVYKKISSKVDFSASFSCAEQSECFIWNASMIKFFLAGTGGDWVKKKYLEFFRDSGDGSYITNLNY